MYVKNQENRIQIPTTTTIFAGIIFLLVVAAGASALITRTVDAGGLEPTGVYAIDSQNFIACYRGTGDATNNLNYSVSGDGGFLWSNSRVGISTDVEWVTAENSCHIHASDSGQNVVIAYTNDTNNDLYAALSTDFGATWTITPVYEDGASTQTNEVWSYRVNATTIYVAGSITAGAGDTTQFCKSEDGGSMWSCVELIANDALFVRGSAVDSENLFIATAESVERHSVFESNNGGDSWTSTEVSSAIPAATAFDMKTTEIGMLAALRTTASPDLYVMFCTEDGWATIDTCGVLRLDSDGTGSAAGSPEISTTPGGEFYFAYKDTVNGESFVATKNPSDFGNRIWQGNVTLGDCPAGNGCSGLGLSAFDPNGWIASYADDPDDGVKISALGSSIPNSATVVEGRDVRVNYDNDPSVYVRHDGATTGSIQGQISQFSKLLSGRVNRVACPSTNGYTYDSSAYGLGVTFDDRIVYSCVNQATSEGVLIDSATINNPSYGGVTVLGNTQIESVDVATSNHVVIGLPTENQAALIDVPNRALLWRVDLNDIEHASIDKWQEISWVVSDQAGTRAYDENGVRIVNSPSALGIAIAAQNSTVYVQNSTHLGRYTRSADIITLNTSVTQTGFVGGLRLSKDGAYTLSWNNAGWFLRDSGNLTLLESNDPGEPIRACDMDVRNNRVYCVTQNRVFLWEVFDSTSSLSGGGTPGSENPVLIGVVGDGGVFGQVSTAVGEGGTIPGSDLDLGDDETVGGTGAVNDLLVAFAEPLGLSTVALGFMLGIFVIAVVVYVFAGASSSAVVVAIAAVLGIFAAWFLSLIPTVVLFLTGFIAFAGISYAIFGGRSGGGEN